MTVLGKAFGGLPTQLRIVPYTFLVVVLAVQGYTLFTPAVHATTDSGVQLQWNFEEGSGSTATDSSTSGNTGILFNSPSYVPGNTGLGLSLNGTNQYIRSTSAIASLGTVDEPYALSAWVKVAAGETAGNIVHISSLTSGGGWCIPFLRLEGGKFSATGWDSGLPTSAVSSTTVQADTWYQVLTSWDATNGLRLFVNGVLEDSTPQPNFTAAGSPVYTFIGIGAPSCSQNQGYLKAVVDDVRIYSRALDTEDIEEISNPDDNDGIAVETEDAAPNSGDANGDGIADSTEPNVASYVNPTTSNYATLEVPSSCSVNSVESKAEDQNGQQDGLYQYPLGMMHFATACGTPGFSAQIVQYYYGADTSKTYAVRKYIPGSGAYTALPGATYSPVTVGGVSALKVTYTITDGGPYDTDGAADGTITDPAGLGIAAASTPNTGLPPRRHW
jgi:hypothetical protein